MHYYHTDEGVLPSIERFDYGGYKFDDVSGDDRFRQRRKALTDYRAKLRQQIVDCTQALIDAGETMEMETDVIW